MTRTQTASERITEEATSWPGVSAGPGERGEFAFRLGRRKLGHLHGDRVFHCGFPKAVWQQLFDQVGLVRAQSVTLAPPEERAVPVRAGAIVSR